MSVLFFEYPGEAKSFRDRTTDLTMEPLAVLVKEIEATLHGKEDLEYAEFLTKFPKGSLSALCPKHAKLVTLTEASVDVFVGLGIDLTVEKADSCGPLGIPI